jgi:hypothetical protein
MDVLAASICRLVAVSPRETQGPERVCIPEKKLVPTA